MLIIRRSFVLQVYNLHRSPYFWDNPNDFEPERFQVPKLSQVDGWAGFDPSRSPGALYPNEVIDLVRGICSLRLNTYISVLNR